MQKKIIKYLINLNFAFVASKEKKITNNKNDLHKYNVFTGTITLHVPCSYLQCFKNNEYIEENKKKSDYIKYL